MPTVVSQKSWQQPGEMPYIIAAIDDNHNGDLNLAMRLIDVAAECGCNAVKLTARTVDLSAPRSLLDRPLLRYPSLGRSLREVRARLALSVDQHIGLKEHAAGRLDYIIAPYDLPALESIVHLGASALHVDSACATHLSLLEAISRLRMPVYAAVGACTDREVAELVSRLEACRVTLLHTINGVPDQATLIHLRGLEWLRGFGCPVGHGDDGPGLTLAVAAVLLGATVVEKRLTLDRTMQGPHHASSVMPAELREMVSQVRELKTLPMEEIRRQIRLWDTEVVEGRPSIVAQVPIAKGTLIRGDMLTLKPPMRGLSPRLLPWVVSRRAKYDIAADDFITFGLVE